MDTETDSHPTVLQVQRRRIFEQTKTRYAARGIALDDPIYLGLIEQWIAGAITMREAMEQWQDARRSSRSPEQAAGPNKDAHNHLSMTTAELLAEVETAMDGWSVTEKSGSLE